MPPLCHGICYRKGVEYGLYHAQGKHEGGGLKLSLLGKQAARQGMVRYPLVEAAFGLIVLAGAVVVVQYLKCLRRVCAGQIPLFLN